jgi:tRNA modification GTPase
MNLLLRRDRVIVSPIPGTTRDAVEEMISIRGIPIRLVDTAGIGKTKNSLEHEGIARSRKYLDLADIAIVVLDYSTRLSAEDLAIMKMVEGKKKIFVVNKSDLRKRIDLNRVKRLLGGEKIVTVSVEKRRKIDALEGAIAGLIWQGGFDNCETAVVSNARHKALIDNALESMISAKDSMKTGGREELAAIDLRDASKGLGLIVGKAVSEDVLERIFEQFCVGK